MKRRRSIVTLLVFAAAATSAAWAAPPILRVRAASLEAVVGDVSAASAAVGHPVEREATLAALAFVLKVPDLSFVDPGKPLAFAMPMEGMAGGPDGMVAVLPVKDRAKAIAALTESVGGHTFDAEVHTFASEDGGRRLFAREAEGALVVGRTRELLGAIDPAEVLSGDGLPAGSVVFSVEIESIAPMLKSGLLFARRQMAEGPPVPPPGPDGVPASPPNPVPKEVLPLLNVYFDLLQDGLDNTSRFQMGISVEAGSIVVRNRLVARKDSALGAFCAAQVLAGSVGATKLVPEDAPMRVAGRIQWTSETLAYLSDHFGRTMDALRSMLDEADPVAAERMEAWVEMWDLTGPSQMMQCARGDFAIATGYQPDGTQTMLQAFGLDTRQACSDLLQSQVERIRAGGKLRESLSEETLEPQKLKTSIVRYTNPVPVPGAPAGASAEEVVVRLAQAEDLFLLAVGEGSADAFRSVLARRPPASDVRGPISPSFVTGHFDVRKMLENPPVDGQPEDPFLRALSDRIQGDAGKIVFGMRFLDSAADLEIGIPLALLDAFGSVAAAQAKENAEEGAMEGEAGAGEDEMMDEDENEMEELEDEP